MTVRPLKMSRRCRRAVPNAPHVMVRALRCRVGPTYQEVLDWRRISTISKNVGSTHRSASEPACPERPVFRISDREILACGVPNRASFGSAPLVCTEGEPYLKENIACIETPGRIDTDEGTRN